MIDKLNTSNAEWIVPHMVAVYINTFSINDDGRIYLFYALIFELIGKLFWIYDVVLYNMYIYKVHCAPYSVRCTVYRVVYGVQCTVYSIGFFCMFVHRTVYLIHCTVNRVVYGVQCTAYNVRCTMYGVQCTVYSVRCRIYKIHGTLINVLRK